MHAMYCALLLFAMKVRDMWFVGLYDYETDAGTAAVSGLGTTAVSIIDSKVRIT